MIDNQSRDIARACGKIDNAYLVNRFDPALHKTENQPIAAEPAIQLSNSVQIPLQLG